MVKVLEGMNISCKDPFDTLNKVYTGKKGSSGDLLGEVFQILKIIGTYGAIIMLVVAGIRYAFSGIGQVKQDIKEGIGYKLFLVFLLFSSLWLFTTLRSIVMQMLGI